MWSPWSQARLTAEKLDELKGVPGFAATFLTDGKPPETGAGLRQAALAATLDHLAKAGLDDFIAAMSAARSPPISNAWAAR